MSLDLAMSLDFAMSLDLAMNWGLDERSRKPAKPSMRKRSTHLATILGVVWKARAAAAFARPPSPGRLRSRCPPSPLDLSASGTHSRACPFGSPRITEVWRHQPSRLKPNGQPPERSQLGREGGIAATSRTNRAISAAVQDCPMRFVEAGSWRAGRVDMATPYLRDILRSSASTACVSSRSGPRSARAIRSTPCVTRPNGNSVSSQDYFDGGPNRRSAPRAMAPNDSNRRDASGARQCDRASLVGAIRGLRASDPFSSGYCPRSARSRRAERRR